MPKGGIIKILHINNDWRVASDANNWILQKHTITEESEEKGGTWDLVGYYPRLDYALQRLMNEDIKLAKTIPDVIERIDSLRELILSINLDAQTTYEK